MDYAEALRYLDTPNFMNPDPGLENIEALLHEMGDIQNKLSHIHIAGTNGKGSTAAFTERILRESGYKTGMYTSPYIQRFSEKIRINGVEISKEDIICLVCKLKEAEAAVQAKGIFPTVFELVTAMAFLYFWEEKCDIVILETGLGGELDATNIIQTSLISVLTTIDYDHMDILGNTLMEIAQAKAGIIKENGTVVCYPQQPEAFTVIQAVCAEKHATLIQPDFSSLQPLSFGVDGQSFSFGEYSCVKTKLLGLHQMYNCGLAIAVAEELAKKGWNITKETVLQGVLQTQWPGRLEKMHTEPLVFIDAAHNPQGTAVLANSLGRIFPNKKITFILGVLADKDYMTMIDTIAPLAESFIAVTPHSPRALKGQTLSEILSSQDHRVALSPTVDGAVEEALALYQQGKAEIICAFGSLYYIGEVRSYLQAHFPNKEGKNQYGSK